MASSVPGILKYIRYYTIIRHMRYACIHTCLSLSSPQTRMSVSATSISADCMLSLICVDDGSWSARLWLEPDSTKMTKPRLKFLLLCSCYIYDYHIGQLKVYFLVNKILSLNASEYSYWRHYWYFLEWQALSTSYSPAFMIISCLQYID